MTKDQLRVYLLSASLALTGLAGFWLWGPISFVRLILGNVAALLTAMSNDDVLLDRIMALINAGTVVLPHPIKTLTTHEVAMLEKPTNAHLNAVIDAAPTSMNA